MTFRTAAALIPALTLMAGPVIAQEAAVAPSAVPVEEPAAAPVTPASPVVTPAAPITPVAPAAEVAPEAGQIGAPVAGKGRIVFFRSSFAGVLIPCTVNEGETVVSRLANGRYFTVDAEPGKHSYFAKSEARDTLAMEIDEGETYYVRCTIAMGMFVGRPNLSPSDKAAFDQVSTRLKLVPPATAEAAATPVAAAPTAETTVAQ